MRLLEGAKRLEAAAVRYRSFASKPNQSVPNTRAKMNRKPMVSVCAALAIGAVPTFLAAQTTATNSGPTTASATAAAEATPADAADEEIVTLSPFEVSAEKDTGYQATETLAGTRIRTELRDVGSAIQVVTKEMLTVYRRWFPGHGRRLTTLREVERV